VKETDFREREAEAVRDGGLALTTLYLIGPPKAAGVVSSSWRAWMGGGCEDEEEGVEMSGDVQKLSDQVILRSSPLQMQGVKCGRLRFFVDRALQSWKNN